MPSRNDHTGDIQQTKVPSGKLIETLRERGELMGVEQRRANKGSWKWDEEQKKYIPVAEWNAKYYKPKPKVPMAIVKNFEPYVSLVSDKVITNKNQKDRDMKEHNCQEYEGFRDESIEANKYRQYKEEQLWANVGETMNQTKHDIDHGYLVPEENPDPLKPAQAWTFDD